MSISVHLEILRNKDFRRLWFSQIASEVAYQIATFSIAVLLYQKTGESVYVTWLIALVALAPILFSMIAGIAADSFDRKKVMLASHAVRLFLSAMLLLALPYPVALIIVGFLLVSVAQFFEPAQVSSIPALVKENQLFSANSYFTFTRYAMFLVGYTVAGPMLANISEQAIAFVIMAMYVFAFVMVIGVRPLRDHLMVVEKVAAFSLLRAIRTLPKKVSEGVRFMLRDKVVRLLLIQVSIIFGIERAFISLAPSFALDWLKISVQDISLYLILPTGIGTLCGTLLANVAKRRVSRNAMVTFGTLLDGVCLISLSLFAFFRDTSGGIFGEGGTTTIVVIGILAFCSGFADPFIIIPAQTVVQERTPKEKRGRIFANLLLFMNALGIIPIIAIGYISTVVPVVTIITALGIIVLIVGIVSAFYWRRLHAASELQAGA